MKKLRKNILIRVGIIALFAIYVFYNNSFIRTSRGNKLQRTINPVPYTEHFDSKQQKPTSFFTAPAFPEYTARCHNNKKLCTIMPLQQLYADMQWLWSIQFVGGQLTQEWLNWLYLLLDNITNLAPYRDYPYWFWQLLIPQQRVSNADKETLERIEKTWKDAGSLAEKGILYTCDQGKIDTIMALSSSGFLEAVYNTWLREELANPCKSYETPYYAWFNAFYYSNNPDTAAKYYKTAAFNDWAPTMTPLMAAIVYGKGGQHIKSATLWFDRYNDIKDQATYDEILAADADKALKKSIMELQLQLLTEASEAVAGSDDPTVITDNTCASSYSCLQTQWALKTAFNKTYTDICDRGRDTQNIRCILLNLGMQNGWIRKDGSFVYPFEININYLWDTNYNSRWIQAK